MSNIVTFTSLGRYGRLCNGMYQIAGTIGIARKNGFQFAFPYWQNFDHRDRFGSTEDIDIQKHFVNPLPLYNGPPLLDRFIHWGYHDVHLTESVSLSGHLQSYKYFAHCFDEVKWYFKMKDEPPLNEYIAIHARLTDYDNAYHPRLDMNYYGPAMERFPGAKFLVFSDDIQTAKSIFSETVEYSEGRDYIEDFKLMKSCQPPGTVIKTPDGDVLIEELKRGDRLVAYSANRQVHKGISKLIGRRDGVRCAPPGRIVQDIGVRPFSGYLNVINTASGRESRYTPNHLCFARPGNAFSNKHLVYLMRKGDQFRVGVTGPQRHPRGRKTERAINNSDVRARLNSSQAEVAWVLTSFNDRDEALLEEKFICAAFGVPDVQFEGWHQNDKHAIRVAAFWERFGPNLAGAVKCLQHYGRHIGFPFFERHIRRDFVTDKELVLNACNLLDGMTVLDADRYLEIAGGKGPCDDAWVKFTRSKEPYTGLVYSMDVEINHSYVADGIATHNCRHFIIGNSSYSAMAAVLGEAKDKKVVAPRPWFGPSYTDITGEDIYNSDWEVINWQ